MYKAKIKLVYRQVIDSSAESAFEKAILQASYQEFLLKSQVYNTGGKFKTFSRMKANDGRANSLHYKLSFSVLHFIEQLDNKIPLLKDNLSNKIAFDVAAFELIESHIEDSQLHKVAINYHTGELMLIDFMGDYLLLAKQTPVPGEAAETFVLRMQPDLSITNYRSISQLAVSDENQAAAGNMQLVV